MCRSVKLGFGSLDEEILALGDLALGHHRRVVIVGLGFRPNSIELGLVTGFDPGEG